eukprot:3479470-Pleurochrysis_carterae.AAC.1
MFLNPNPAPLGFVLANFQQARTPLFPNPSFSRIPPFLEFLWPKFSSASVVPSRVSLSVRARASCRRGISTR